MPQEPYAITVTIDSTGQRWQISQYAGQMEKSDHLTGDRAKMEWLRDKLTVLLDGIPPTTQLEQNR
jgi:hypothetical protein